MITLAIDPGIRGVGAAVFVDRILRVAAYVVNPATEGNGPAEIIALARAVWAWMPYRAPDEVVMEWPQVYRAGKLKGDPNDLLPLPAIGTAIAMKCGAVRAVRYLPHEWKGNLTKEVCHERVRERLQAEELPRIPVLAAKVLHNVLDAVGVGLHHVGRLDRRRAP